MQLQGLSPAIVVDCTLGGKGRGRRGGCWLVRELGGPFGLKLMIGNDSAEDTWDNDGVAKSPDD